MQKSNEIKNYLKNNHGQGQTWWIILYLLCHTFCGHGFYFIGCAFMDPCID